MYVPLPLFLPLYCIHAHLSRLVKLIARIRRCSVRTSSVSFRAARAPSRYQDAQRYGVPQREGKWIFFTSIAILADADAASRSCIYPARASSLFPHPRTSPAGAEGFGLGVQMRSCLARTIDSTQAALAPPGPTRMEDGWEASPGWRVPSCPSGRARTSAAA